MLQQVASDLTELLLKKEIVKEQDKEIYTYGFEAMFSTIINTILVLAIGIMAGTLLETLIYLVCFALLRVYCGGYHAKTHVGCVLTFVGLYGSAMYIPHLIPAQYNGLLSIAIGGISLTAILLYAPIEHPNRPFVGNEYKTFRKLARIIALLEAALIVFISAFCKDFSKIALIISIAMISVVFMLALAKIIERKR